MSNANSDGDAHGWPGGRARAGPDPDLPAAKAKALIDGGFARLPKEAAKAAPPPGAEIESEMLEPPETAVMPDPEGKGKGKGKGKGG